MANKKMVMGPRGKMVPSYAMDGKGSNDLKKSGYGSMVKSTLKKGKLGMIAETDMMQYGKNGVIKYGKGSYVMERRNKNYSKK